MSKKVERNGPSWTEVIIGAVLSLALGVAAGFVYLVLKPVAAVKALPKEPAADVVYFIEGSHDSSKARQAAAKQHELLQGRAIALNEDELNALFAPAAAATPTPAKPAGKGSPAAPAAAAPTQTITPEAPNFRVHDGVVQIGLPVRIAAFGWLDQKVILQATGTFAKEGDTFVFQPTEFYLGSCPIQRLPAVKNLIFKRVVAAAPAELHDAWGKLTDVTVEGPTLKLAVQ